MPVRNREISHAIIYGSLPEIRNTIYRSVAILLILLHQKNAATWCTFKIYVHSFVYDLPMELHSGPMFGFSPIRKLTITTGPNWNFGRARKKNLSKSNNSYRKWCLRTSKHVSRRRNKVCDKRRNSPSMTCTVTFRFSVCRAPIFRGSFPEFQFHVLPQVKVPRMQIWGT
jgi:hypothetical protein